MHGSDVKWTWSVSACVPRSMGDKISTKDPEAWYECLQSLMPKLARSMSGVIVEQMGFDRDHVHFPT